MTEDEAKTKSCPHYRRPVSGGSGGGNVDADGFPRTKCFASACMMWVTTEGHNKQGDCGLKKSG